MALFRMMPSPDGSAIRLHHLRIAVNTRNVGSAGTHQGSPLPAILAAVVDQQIQPVILGPPVAGAGLAHSAARATPAGYNAPKTRLGPRCWYSLEVRALTCLFSLGWAGK